MFKKSISILISLTLVFSLAACSNTGSSTSSEPAAAQESAPSDAEAEDTADTEAEKDAAAEAVVEPETDAAAEAVVEPETDAAAEADAQAETSAADDELLTEAATLAATDGALGAAPEAPGSTGEEEYDAMYAFVNVKYEGTNIVVIPNGTVNDDTVLYNGKTLGALCDYIDTEVLEEGRTINRKFLYGLTSVQIVDPQLMTAYEQFQQAMIYCLTIANEFYSVDVTLNNLVLDTTNNTKQVFHVVAAGKEDSWILDGHEKKFYLNGGSTEYESTMFDAETMAVWSVVLDTFFEVEN